MQSANTCQRIIQKLQKALPGTETDGIRGWEPVANQPGQFYLQLEAGLAARFLLTLFSVCRQEGASFSLLRCNKTSGRLTIQLIDAAMQTACIHLTLSDSAGAGPASPGQGVIARSRGRHKNKLTGWLAGQSVKLVPRTTAVIGPDGSGKTALIEALKTSPSGSRYRYQRFKRFFRRILFHIRKSQNRNTLESSMQWLILPISWCYFYWSRYVSNRLSDVVLDRYFYDYFVRNIRDTTAVPEKIAHYALCSRLTPAPVRLVVAMCPAEIIRKRKSEMSVAAIDYLYDIYWEQILIKLPARVLFCHTGLGQAASVAHFLEFMESTASLD